MKRIIYIALLCCLPVLGGCDKWLDVKPYDKIGEEELFSSEDGFRKLLNGIYVELNDEALYGGALMTEMIEIMGGAVKVGSDVGAWREYVDLAAYSYGAEYWRGRISQTWNKAYELVMNCNKLLDNMEERRSLFSPTTYDLIRGEALALRAMLQFDMLRLFGPVPNEEGRTKTSIPYYRTQTTNILPLLTMEEAMELVLQDLKDAETALADDPVIASGTMMSPAEGSDTDYLRYRALRMNYYAVQALLARAYLWNSDKENALDYAGKVISAANSGRFPFAERTTISDDRIFSSEVIFALTDTDRRRLFRNAYDPARVAGAVFTMDPDLLSYVFGYASDGGSTSDYRYIANWRRSSIPGSADTYFYHYDDMADASVIQNTMVPMLRLGEMYLIATEASGAALADGVSWVNELRSHRGVNRITSLNRRRISVEYIRELYGEGQLFFYYKRTYTTIYNADDDNWPVGKSPSDAVFVVPLPQSETDNRQTI